MLRYLAIGGMVIFYLLILVVGMWAGRRSKGANSTDEMLLAGRKLPLWVGIFTMTATWVGGGYINGTAEAVYGSGFLWTQAPWGYGISLLIGGLCFAGIMRRRRYTTMLDPFAERYGHKVTSVLFIPALIGEIFWSAAILAALGSTFATILDLDLTTSIVMSAVIAVAYTYAGGLWAVAYTDVAQLILLFFGLAVAIPFALPHIGDLGQLFDAYQAKFGDATQWIPPLAAWRGEGEWGHQAWYWLDMAILLMLGGIPWGVYFQRVLASPSARVARNLSICAAAGCALMAIPPIIVGAIGATVDWQAVAGIDAPEGALVLPYVLQHLTHPAVVVLGMGAVAAAVMSSVDSSVLSASSMFVWNVYRPLVAPKAPNQQLMRVSRLAVIFIGAAALGLALSVRSVYALWYLCADLVFVVLFPQLVAVLFFKSAHRMGAISGVVVGLFLRLGGGEPALGISPFLNYPMQDPELGSMFPFRTCAMLASLITIWGVSEAVRILGHSKSTPRPSDAPLPEASA